MKKLDSINQFVNHYLTVFVLVSVVISLILPAPFASMGRMNFGTLFFGSHSFTLSLTSVMLMIIMLGAGCSISAKEIIGAFHRPQDLVVSIFAKYFMMAAGAWITAHILKLNDQLAFGLILLGAMPSGTGAAVLVTLAGLFVDGNGQVLNQDFEPIPGLFAVGHASGGRFPLQYTSPMNGISIGMATVLGALTGEYIGTEAPEVGH